MPTSYPHQINEIVRLVLAVNPASLLDIGVGFGKYGFLAREYLELFGESEQYAKWKRRALPGLWGDFIEKRSDPC